MNSYAYEAVNARGASSAGVIEVDTQSEAVRRIKEMGLFPVRISERQPRRLRHVGDTLVLNRHRARQRGRCRIWFAPRIKSATITVMTRQLATLTEAGLPLLRGLKILEQQEGNRRLQRILAEVAVSIEDGSQLSEALAQHPKVFNRLYVNMVRAGEVGGALETTLRRLAEFMEKAQRIKARIKAAMFYPASVLIVAAGILQVMLVFVIPRFKEVFVGLTNGAPLPAFTSVVLGISDFAQNHFSLAALLLIATPALVALAARTRVGRLVLDQGKLRLPILGRVFRQAAIARFARTLGTLLGSGVPVLQALTIVRETTGNVVVGNLVATLHDGVKEGENLTAPLRASNLFPPIIVGMVDIGEQTGALPDMLMKVAEGCDEQVDNAVSALTSLLEPIMIVFLAVVVGSLVIAMFLPILGLVNGPGLGGDAPSGE